MAQIKGEKTSWQAVLTEQEEANKKLEAELAETNNDFLLISENNSKLKRQLLVARRKETELASKLAHEINETARLKISKEQTFNSLLAKYQGIARAKEAGEKQRQELAHFIQQQEDNYQQEKQARESQFQKQLDNLRTFQSGTTLARPTNQLTKPTHNRANSLYNMEVKDDTIVFSSRPKSRPLLSELQQEGYQEKFGVITAACTNSPLANSADDVFASSFAQPAAKRQSTSSLLNLSLPSSLSQEEVNIDHILSEIVDLGTDYHQWEHQQWQVEKIACEVQTQKLNEKCLNHQAEKKEWNNELGQVKYQLQASQAQHRRTEQELVNVYQQVAELEEKLREQAAD
ncbi:MAG: hypothetical protein NY202_03075 [Mollicutes bacterium UO1]